LSHGIKVLVAHAMPRGPISASQTVTVYILDGQAELTARRDLTLEWFAELQAPRKRMFSFDEAAHSVVFEEFQAFAQLMTTTIVPETITPDAGVTSRSS